MADLSDSFIANKVLQMLTGGVIPPQLKPKWQPKAHKYLQQCLRLYKQDQQLQDTEHRQRMECSYKFLKLLQVLGDKKQDVLKPEELFFNGRWPSENNKPDDATVVILQILSQQEQIYLSAIRTYLCEKIKTLFAETANLYPAEGWWVSKIVRLTGHLTDPIVLTLNEIRALIQFVRSLPVSGRSRTEDIRLLIMLWQKAPEVVKTGKSKEIAELLTDLVQRQRVGTYDLALDLIYTYSESPEYCENIVSRLAAACAYYCEQTWIFRIVEPIAVPKQIRRAAATALDELEQICQKWQPMMPMPIVGLPQGLRDEIAYIFDKIRLENDRLKVTLIDKDGIRLWHLQQEMIGQVCYEALSGGTFLHDNGTMIIHRIPGNIMSICQRCGRIIEAEKIGSKNTERVLCPHCHGNGKMVTKSVNDGVKENGTGKSSEAFWQYRFFQPWGIYLFAEVHFEPNVKMTVRGQQEDKTLTTPASEIVSNYRKVANSLLSSLDSQKDQHMRQFRDQVICILLDVCPPAPLLQRRLWLSEMCLKIWEEDPAKSKCLQMLRDIATIEALDKARWKQALGDVCRSEKSETALKKYLYRLLYDLLVIFISRTGTVELHSSLAREKRKVPDHVHLVMQKCMANEFFDREFIDIVLHRLMSDINKANNKVIIEHYEQYIDCGLWLANFFEERNIARKCAERMSQYYLLQPKHHCKTYAKIVLRLLYGVTYFQDELKQINADIEQLFDRDTYHSQYDLPEPELVSIKTKKSHNLTVCQDVKAMLDNYRSVS